MKKASKGDRLPSGYKARHKENLERLDCDLCGKFICWVYEYDLNESHFYCSDCYKDIPEYYFPHSV